MHLGMIWIVSSGSVLGFFHDKQLRGHLSLSFCIQFFKQHVSTAL
jgi:hypothetical protein